MSARTLAKGHKKDVELLLLPVPRTEALACLLKLNRQR